MNNIILFICIQSICAAVIGWIMIALFFASDHESGTAIVISLVVSFIVAFPIASLIKKKITRE